VNDSNGHHRRISRVERFTTSSSSDEWTDEFVCTCPGVPVVTITWPDAPWWNTGDPRPAVCDRCQKPHRVITIDMTEIFARHH